MSYNTTVVAFWRFALEHPRRHVLLLLHNLFPGAHFFTSEGWKVMKQGKVVRVFFKTGSYFIPWQLKVADITELDINIFWFQFWSHTVKTLSRNHDTQSRRRWNFHRVICQNRSSLVLYWLAWAHQSPFSPGYVNDLNILLLHALVLINRRDSEEGCSKSRDTRCPVYSIDRF